MKKASLLKFCLIIALAGISLGVAPRLLTDDGKIIWTEGHRLDWTDFQGKPDRSSHMLAMTESGIDLGYSCDGDVFEVSIIAKFDPQKSWKKRSASDNLLPHEQLHFDITELAARKMRKAFTEMANPCDLPRGQLEKIARQHFSNWNEMQMKYDRETRHSIDKEKQQAWETKVARELKKYADYAL